VGAEVGFGVSVGLAVAVGFGVAVGFEVGLAVWQRYLYRLLKSMHLPLLRALSRSAGEQLEAEVPFSLALVTFEASQLEPLQSEAVQSSLVQSLVLQLASVQSEAVVQSALVQLEPAKPLLLRALSTSEGQPAKLEPKFLSALRTPEGTLVLQFAARALTGSRAIVNAAIAQTAILKPFFVRLFIF